MILHLSLTPAPRRWGRVRIAFSPSRKSERWICASRRSGCLSLALQLLDSRYLVEVANDEVGIAEFVTGAAQDDERVFRRGAEVRMRDRVVFPVAHMHAERVLVGIPHQHAQLFLFHASKMPDHELEVNAVSSPKSDKPQQCLLPLLSAC